MNNNTNIDESRAKTSTWRETARYPRFLCFDARCLFPIGVWLFHICMATFYVAVAGVLFFSFLEFFKITPVVIFRSVRAFISGPKRSIYDPIVYRRRLKS